MEDPNQHGSELIFLILLTDHFGPAPLGRARLLLDHPQGDSNMVRLPRFPRVGCGVEPIMPDRDLALVGYVGSDLGGKLQVAALEPGFRSLLGDRKARARTKKITVPQASPVSPPLRRESRP